MTLKVTDISSGQFTFSSRFVEFHYCDESSPLQVNQEIAQLHESESSEVSIMTTSTQINISSPNAKVELLDAVLYSVDGRVVAKQSKSATLALSTHLLPSGMYYLRITDAEGRLIKSTPVWHFR